MNTLLIMFLTTTYIFILIFLVFIFYKNDYDLRKSIRYIKVKILSCCIKDKKKLIKTVGKDGVIKIENQLLDIDDCEAPLNFPLDLCFSSELQVEEVKIREKILKTLKEKDNFIIDGGKEKLIVPLEATLFLTKSLSPLVTEDGSIQVISEHKPIERTELEEIRIYIKSLKDEQGELLYKDDEEILDLIKKSISEDIKEKQFQEDNINISKEIEEIKEKEEKSKDIDKKLFDPSLLKNEDDLIFDDDEEEKIDTNLKSVIVIEKEKEKEKESTLDDLDSSLEKEINKKEEISLDDLGSSLDKMFEEDDNNNETSLDSLGANSEKEEEESVKTKENPRKVEAKPVKTKEDHKKIEEDPIEAKEEDNFTIEDNPFGDSGEIDFSMMEQAISDEVDSLDFGDIEEVKDDTNRESFYTKRKYSSIKVKQIRKDNLKEDLESILDNDDVKKAILNNIIKTKPLIFNENKEVVFIDQKNFIFALSKVYGMESTKILKSFESYSMKETILLSRVISVAMEDYVSDLITGNKKVNRILLEKNKDLYFSFGLFLMTSSFLNVLSQDDYDLFRAMPYNTEYKISNSSERTNTALIPSLKDVEI